MLRSELQSKLMWGLMAGFFMLASGFAMAAANSGKVLTSRGTVTAEFSGRRRPLRRGDSFSVNDRIVTGDKSYVGLQLADGAQVTLFPNTAIVVEYYRYDDTQQDAATLSLEAGSLRIIAGAMAKSNPEGFKVRTPVALMTVRGPEFDLMLCGDQICTEDEPPN